MELCDISEKEYREFWEKSEQKTFLSAPEVIGLAGEKKLYLGVKKEGKMVAAAGIRGAKQRFFGYDFYAPRGFLADFNDCATLEFFAKELKKRLKREKGVKLRIEPAVKRVERDIDGREVEGGYDNRGVEENLKKAGFSRVPYREGRSQITWQFVLPVKGKTEEKLLADMKPNTRRRLKQAEQLGIKVRELKREELKEFFEILTDTAGRKNFSIRDLAYYQKIYDLMAKKGMVKFMAATVKPSEAMKKIEEEEKGILREEPKTIREKQDHRDKINSIKSRKERVKEIFGEEIKSDKEIILSSGMFYTIKPEILHLSGGNRGKYIKLDGQYVLQWEMIKRALREGYDRYNFYGIAEKIYEKPEGYGVYEFKRGFFGVVEEFLGEYEMEIGIFGKVFGGLSRILRK